MPCNKSGFTSVDSLRGWAIQDFDWSNAKEIWDKHTPMDDEELLYQQVQVRQGGARLRALIAARRSPLPSPPHTHAHNADDHVRVPGHHGVGVSLLRLCVCVHLHCRP